MAQLYRGWGRSSCAPACDGGTGLRPPQPAQQGEELSTPVSLMPQASSQRGTHMHGKDAAGDELSMLADAEMPRLYPHHVVEHELQVEPPLHTHLGRAQGQAQPAAPFPQPRSPGNPRLHTATHSWWLAPACHETLHKPNPQWPGDLCKNGMLQDWLRHVELQHGAQQAMEISLPRPVGLQPPRGHVRPRHEGQEKPRVPPVPG